MSESPAERHCSRRRMGLPRQASASNRAMPDGLQASCRKCSAEYYRQRQEAKGKSVRVKVEWERNKSSSDGWSSYCRECRAERNRISYSKHKCGLAPAELDALIAARQGVCCICPIAPAEHVDHCHETGRVRGVLCFSCNAALGQFKGRPDAIRRAAAYVEGNAWKPTLVAPGVYQLPS